MIFFRGFFISSFFNQLQINFNYSHEIFGAYWFFDLYLCHQTKQKTRKQ